MQSQICWASRVVHIRVCRAFVGQLTHSHSGNQVHCSLFFFLAWKIIATTDTMAIRHTFSVLYIFLHCCYSVTVIGISFTLLIAVSYRHASILSSSVRAQMWEIDLCLYVTHWLWRSGFWSPWGRGRGGCECMTGTLLWVFCRRRLSFGVRRGESRVVLL